jgi:hypothetical protein
MTSSHVSADFEREVGRTLFLVVARDAIGGHQRANRRCLIGGRGRLRCRGLLRPQRCVVPF